eukprot:TRINITY_DN24617_c0_g1_i1.p1 TRINITY_DN24617_c0_g1~~TRINITY_DN24617_c0_g1_i1.p1  ORF type:complete len:517 (+),score=68.06 TRINITY_DN24617_c0_g1_i1:105-1553(+)
MEAVSIVSRVAKHCTFGAVVAGTLSLWGSGCNGIVAAAITTISSSLDPATYTEPDEAEYWSVLSGEVSTVVPTVPLDARRLSNLTRETFDRLIVDGKVFVVPGLSDNWKMRDWDCDFFQKDAEFKKAEVRQQYTNEAKAHVKFQEDWQSTKTPTGVASAEAPELAPFYWGIKDVQYDDGWKSPTWKKSMLKRVQKSFKLPDFMAKSNERDFKTTPEFWMGTVGSGAKAHMDSHVQATVSVQLAGTKRWRLKTMGPRLAPYLASIYNDGDVYKESESWDPTFNVTLRKGEALFFPPGTIHETLAVGEACSSSVTFQFRAPFAARFYRRFFPRIRRTADIHEAWPYIREWATLGFSGFESGLSYVEAKQKAPAMFNTVDKNGDGILSVTEIAGRLHSPETAADALMWHDLDESGGVDATEFAEGFGFWADITRQAIEDTNPKWRSYHLNEDFNIEDLSPAVQKRMIEYARKIETKIQHAQNTEL